MRPRPRLFYIFIYLSPPHPYLDAGEVRPWALASILNTYTLPYFFLLLSNFFSPHPYIFSQDAEERVMYASPAVVRDQEQEKCIIRRKEEGAGGGQAEVC